MPLSGQELEIAGRLKYFRETHEIKQKEVAAGSKTSQGHLSEMEKGEKQLQPRVVIFLSERYGLNVDWLFTGRGEMNISAVDKVEEPPAKYGRSDIKKLEEQIRGLEDRVKKMEGKKE